MDTKIIVITCVHDETDHIERFLSTCSCFADHILIHDETAHDNTRSFYPKYPKVIAYCNDGPSMFGMDRMLFLIDEARKISCEKRILVVLDADEILSSEIFTSNEWRTVLNASPGTLFYLQWVTLWKNPLKYTSINQYYCGSPHGRIWVDDGKSTLTTSGSGRHGFHSHRLPRENVQRIIYLYKIVILHYQFTNWGKMESKHRWYRCFEKAEIRKLSNLGIFRMYGYMDTGKEPTLSDSPESWFEDWKTKGVDVTSISSSPIYLYDMEVLKLFKKYTPQFFTWQDVWRWNVDWNNIIKKAKELGFLEKGFRLEIPKQRLIPKVLLKLGRIIGRSKKWLAIERIFFRRFLEYRKNDGE